jgi:hypothetical protein
MARRFNKQLSSGVFDSSEFVFDRVIRVANGNYLNVNNFAVKEKVEIEF